MHKIQKLSSYLLFTFNILLIGLPLFIMATWYFIDSYTINELSKGLLQNPFQGLENYHNLNNQNYSNLNNFIWTPLSKSIAMSGHALSLLPLFLSLFILKLIFRNYKNGEIFSAANAIQYKYLGWLFFLNALMAKPLGNALMVMATTLSNPPGERYISIFFGAPSLEGIFGGSILIVISWVMFEASKLQDESKFII